MKQVRETRLVVAPAEVIADGKLVVAERSKEHLYSIERRYKMYDGGMSIRKLAERRE